MMAADFLAAQLILAPSPRLAKGNRAAVWAAAVTCLFGWAALPQRAGSQPLPLPPADQELVNQAIDLGAVYLKDNQEPSGSWAKDKAGHEVGYAALPGLTLLVCGVPRSEPVIKQAADFVRRHAAKLDRTYELALAILFLDRLGHRQDRALIQTLALRLIAGQSPTGGWSYRCPVLNSINEHDLWVVLHRKAKMLKRLSIPAAIRGLPVLQDPSSLVLLDPPDKLETPIIGTTDNSNTQFALLAVWAARRHRVPAERTLNLIVQRFHTSQNADGGWGYRYLRGGGAGDSPPMNCVGILGLALGHRLADKSTPRGKALLLLGARTTAEVSFPASNGRFLALFLANQIWEALQRDKPGKHDPRLVNGFTALTRHIGQPAGTMKNLPMPNLYFLWSVERTAVLFGLPTIGNKDWYRWGAEMLVANQQADGHWEKGGYPGSSSTIDTCLALLFLRRANLARDLSTGLHFKPKDLTGTTTQPPPKPTKPEPTPVKTPIETPKPPPQSTEKPTPPQSPPEPPPPPAAEEAGANPLGLILGGVGLICVLGGGAFLLLQRRGRPDEEEPAPRKKKKASQSHHPERPPGKRKPGKKNPGPTADND